MKIKRGLRGGKIRDTVVRKKEREKVEKGGSSAIPTFGSCETRGKGRKSRDLLACVNTLNQLVKKGRAWSSHRRCVRLQQLRIVTPETADVTSR